MTFAVDKYIWERGDIVLRQPTPEELLTHAKGDVTGHDFHGNRWTGGIGGGTFHAETREMGIDVAGNVYRPEELHEIFDDQKLSRLDKQTILEYRLASAPGLMTSKEVNDALRNYDVPRNTDAVQIMDAAIANNTLPPDMKTLVRGVDAKALDVASLTPGDVIHDKGFTSWTVPPHGVVRDFPIGGRTGDFSQGMRAGQEHNPVIVYEPPAGQHAVVAVIEAILPRDAAYTVTRVEASDPKWWGRPTVYVK